MPPSASTASTSPSVGPRRGNQSKKRGLACLHVNWTHGRGSAGLSGEAFSDHGDIVKHISASS